LAERVIGWRPTVDMREGIGRLLAWRDASKTWGRAHGESVLRPMGD